MQLTSPAPFLASHRPRLSFIAGASVAAVLLVSGLGLAWLAFGTPLMSVFTPAGRPSVAQTLIGMGAWGFALIAPATFVIVGIARLGAAIQAARSAMPRMTPAARAAGQLGDDCVVAHDVVLPDGRPVRELVLGPFGAAVIDELPPPSVVRRSRTGWEIRSPRGTWLPIENPLDRASRNADRVRRWMMGDDRDHVVKVYAAVVTTDASLSRTATCAVITPDQVPAWLRSLPAQRSLTRDRLASLAELVREA